MRALRVLIGQLVTSRWLRTATAVGAGGEGDAVGGVATAAGGCGTGRRCDAIAASAASRVASAAARAAMTLAGDKSPRAGIAAAMSDGVGSNVGAGGPAAATASAR